MMRTMTVPDDAAENTWRIPSAGVEGRAGPVVPGGQDGDGQGDGDERQRGEGAASRTIRVVRNFRSSARIRLFIGPLQWWW